MHEVENEGFRYLMKVVAPHYTVPCATTITALIDKRYEIVVPVVKERFQKAADLTITSDAWTETMNNQTFLSLTTHFMEDNELVSFPVGIEPLDQSHTGEYLGKTLQKMCERWEISDEKITACVTDNASNIALAIAEFFGKSKHLPCWAHTSQLIPKEIFEHPDVKTVLDKVKRIIKLFKQSTLAADALRQAQGAAFLKLISSTEIRWNSVYYSLVRFVMLIVIINGILIDYPRIEAMTAAEVEILKELIDLLKPLEVLTRKISGEKYFTSSRVIPQVRFLKKDFAKLEGTLKTDISKLSLGILNKAIAKRFGKVESNHFLAVATILDPRFKKVYFTDIVALTNALNRINSLIKRDLQNANSTNVPQPQPEEGPVAPEASKEEDEFWQFHREFSKQNHTGSDEFVGYHPELKLYLDLALEDPKSDPIQYWCDQKKNFPHLAKVALKYVSVVATSVSSERLFSKAGIHYTRRRNRLKGKRVSTLLFLQALPQKLWLL